MTVRGGDAKQCCGCGSVELPAKYKTHGSRQDHSKKCMPGPCVSVRAIDVDNPQPFNNSSSYTACCIYKRASPTHHNTKPFQHTNSTPPHCGYDTHTLQGMQSQVDSLQETHAAGDTHANDPATSLLWVEQPAHHNHHSTHVRQALRQRPKPSPNSRRGPSTCSSQHARVKDPTQNRATTEARPTQIHTCCHTNHPTSPRPQLQEETHKPLLQKAARPYITLTQVSAS